ncbi:4-(cytidine 5'-diphospho)-2-C-methyl-D-erythritol kinase [Suipraeoptans intestinalis]|uniref:4-diphosphocytidyl-2-C-methyl-D-erythritol kinase n=1 Tax=Suipraeoptans intestinalis TaxID=2606628 RepID=A0A6N7V0S2_9FIRM|nr:4-(cytidine 5'-diphospho)-2-C-methyl-D-erythritol kinase [Suipraeoptans intestinalis]MDD7769971.1 4-(cytidine 5'-diphospho)-2-C-methyl-D-erythritol kinase [Suipraeoptans intestinalis]MDY3121961.1 4-(cytidine 5'-diphospho)-2-C-methyl-D-erythritol kinase [Suipraeoptans intestinalis]MSR94179.1 4-(cytidine 5'-diphospho)-2-C-methyl-D-erythritol kinase [Suipraeoptans intestinalis]
MDQIELKALGKVNLGLDVLGRRDNGYHDVRMVMQSVYLYDDICIKKKKEQGIELTTNLFFLPANEKNLAYRAARLLLEEFQIDTGIRMHIEKRIPVAGGMAGGSTDAASVLFGINRLFQLGLSQKELMKRGETLGADVPYCILRGTALAEGIGEKLTPLPDLPKCIMVIAKPPVSVSTAKVYEKLDGTPIKEHPPIDGILEGLQAGSLETVVKNMGNVLESVTVKEYPVIADIKESMIQNGAVNAMMSGSGPTVFGIFENRRQAASAAKRLWEQRLAKQIYVTNVHRPGRR